jgi:hypothetical protein
LNRWLHIPYYVNVRISGLNLATSLGQRHLQVPNTNDPLSTFFCSSELNSQ